MGVLSWGLVRGVFEYTAARIGPGSFSLPPMFVSLSLGPEISCMLLMFATMSSLPKS